MPNFFRCNTYKKQGVWALSMVSGKKHTQDTDHGTPVTSHQSPFTALPIPAITSAIMRNRLKTNCL